MAFFLAILVAPSPVFWEIVPRHVGALEPLYTSLLLYLSDVPLLVAVFAWGSGHVLSPGRAIALGPWYVAGPAFVLIVLTGLSPAWARAMPVAVEVAGRTIILFGFYLIAANDPPARTLLLRGLALGVVIHSPVALAQFLTQGPVGLGALGEITWHEYTPGAWLRGYGLTLHPNVLGGFLALGLLGIAGRWLMPSAPAGTSRSARSLRRDTTLASAILALGIAGLLSTFSRSAWLGLAGGSTYLGFLALRDASARRALRAQLRPALLLIAVVLVFSSLYSRLLVTRLVLPVESIVDHGSVPGAQLEMAVLAERDRLHQTALDLIAADPLLGVGAGNFAIASYERLGPIEPFRLYQPEHNVPLLVVAELGPLGGAAWLVLAISPLIAQLRRARGHRNLRAALWAATLVTVLIISGFDFYFWGREQGRVLFWALLGAWVGDDVSFGQLSQSSANCPGDIAPTSFEEADEPFPSATGS